MLANGISTIVFCVDRSVKYRTNHNDNFSIMHFNDYKERVKIRKLERKNPNTHVD